MKKIIILLLLCPNLIYAQFFSGGHFELKYDNFTGSDSKDYQTNMQGFGSINMNFGYDLKYSIGKGAIKPFLNFGLGYASKIFRFKNDWIFEDQDGQLIFQPDELTHSYSEDFFSYSKSKLYNYYIRLNPEFGFTMFNALLISGGPIIDLRVYIFQKNKYKIDDTRYSNELRRNNFFNSNLFHFGWRVNFGTPLVGVFGTYIITPFFKEDTSPEISPIEIGIYFREFEKD